VFPGGERFEVLVDASTALPRFHETVYAVATLRARDSAVATIQNNNKSLQALHLALAAMGTNLEARLTNANVFGSSELIGLARHLRKPIKQLRVEIGRGDYVPTPGRIASLENVRAKVPQRSSQSNTVSRAVSNARLRDAISYIIWRYQFELESCAQGSDRQRRFGDAIKTTERFLRLQRRVRGRSKVGKREGLSKPTLDLLREVIAPDSDQNPWPNPFCRARNEIILMLGLDLGLRIGEILGICIEDLNLSLRRVLIRRRADDPDDPRPDQPNGKTADRVLSYNEELAQRIEDYIIHLRSEIPGADDHSFLIVATYSGKPLGRSAAKKVYSVLRTKVPRLPKDLSSHVSRHTFNDELSDTMDEQRVPEAKEAKLRNYLNGWSDQSTTAETYTRRHTRRKANEISLAVQRRSVPKGGASE
jgi:integrase